MREQWPIRLACENDISKLEMLIPLSVRALQSPFYSPAQMEAALGPVFGVDRQLISDRTYFVVEYQEKLVGCGGWSRRKAVFGGDRGRKGEDAPLDPACDQPAFARSSFTLNGFVVVLAVPSLLLAKTPFSRRVLKLLFWLPRSLVNPFMQLLDMLLASDMKFSLPMAFRYQSFGCLKIFH